MLNRSKASFLGKVGVCVAAAAFLAVLAPASSRADEVYGDGKPWKDFYAAMKGKTVAFVPMAMSFDLAQIYDGAMREQAKTLGFKYLMRDPNWSVENAVQIAEQFINEKPDIMVIHPLDDKAFTRVVKRAQAAGIYVIFMNLRNGAGTDSFGGDAFIGPDFFEMGKAKVRLAAKYCANAPTKKIGLVRASTTNSVGITETAGTLEELKSHPDIKLVAQQSAEADPNKAKSIVETVLKQNPDLCAVIDQWEGEAIGVASALDAAGLKGKVPMITSGGGSVANACDKVSDGSYSAYFSYNAGHETYQLKALIEQVLQLKPKPGSNPFSVYIDVPVITKETMTPNSCWDIKFYARPLD